MELLMLCIPALAIFLASFFATVTGFGFGLIAVPLMSLVISVKVAIICGLIITVLLRIITMYNTRKIFSWEVVLTTVLGSTMGMLPGSYVLKIFSLAHLKIFLAIVLLMATYLMGKQYHLEIKSKTLGRLTAGFFSGFFGASTSVAGPPLVIYFLNEGTEKDKMRANMIWIFGRSFVGMFIINFFMGNMNNITDWNVLLPMIPAMILGIVLGEKFFERLDQELFRRLAIIIVCVGAVMMLLTGVREIL